MEHQTTIIDILRHGEPIGGSKYRGQIDDPLSEKGWRQMRTAVAGRDEWQHIVSSDLSRCADFARELGASLAIDVELDPGFREVGFGRWEGKSASELLAEDPEGTAAFWHDPINNTPPGAEPLREFQERVNTAWQGLLTRHAGKHLDPVTGRKYRLPDEDSGLLIVFRTFPKVSYALVVNANRPIHIYDAVQTP